MSLTKKDLQDALRAQDKRLDERLKQQTEALARIIADAFTEHERLLDARFAKLSEDIHQIHARLADHDLKFKKLEKALGVKL